MDTHAKANFLSFIDDVHLALLHLAREVLMDAEPDALAHAVEVVKDEVR